jgi:TorA-specific chaperone
LTALRTPDLGAARPLAAALEPDLWVWLAGLFAAAPSPEALAATRHGPLADALALLALDDDLAPGLARLRAAAATDEDPASVTARFGIAFGRLFLGIGGPDTVAPYESAHTGTGRLFQAPVGEMERLLAAHDLAVAVDLREPADHLSIELALMARLAAADHPDRTAFAARLAAWVPRFCRLCIAHDPTGYFGGAAEVLAALVAREAERSIVTFDETK